MQVLPALIAGITGYISVYYLLLACMERVIYRNYLHFTRTLPHHICSVVYLKFWDALIISVNVSKNVSIKDNVHLELIALMVVAEDINVTDIKTVLEVRMTTLLVMI